MDRPWDCIVVGGGAAGLSAALVLGRARRSVLVIDAGEQSNLPAHAIGGLLAQEGAAPAALYAAAHAQLAGYPSVELRAGRVTEVAREARSTSRGAAGDPLVDGGGTAGDAGGSSTGGATSSSRADGGGTEDTAVFAVALDGGGVERARRIVLATGMAYVPPELPGLAELWGGAVFHCPFCHGWEVRERPVAVLNGGPHALHQALLLRNWSDDVVLLTDGPATLDADVRAQLAAASVTIDERAVAGLRASADGAGLEAIRFADGGELAREALLVMLAEMTPRAGLATALGVQLDTRGAIVVDAWGGTSVGGVHAAGDAGFAGQVSISIGTGAAAGAGVVQSLIAEQHGLPWPPPAPQLAPAADA